MKTRLMILAFAFLNFISCETVEDESNGGIGTGIEIYLTDTPYTNQFAVDYSTLNFDTLALQDTPILRYHDIKKYDTLTHKVTLWISHDRLNIGDAGVYGRMFVLTADREPIYCGFKWPVISSVPCNWVSIHEPVAELDQLTDHEIVISFNSGGHADPRMDRRIINRLKADRKIK